MSKVIEILKIVLMAAAIALLIILAVQLATAQQIRWQVNPSKTANTATAPTPTLKMGPPPRQGDRWKSVYFEPGELNPELSPTRPGTFTMTLPGEENHSRRPWVLFDLSPKSLSLQVSEPTTGGIDQITCAFGVAFGCTVQNLARPLQ